MGFTKLLRLPLPPPLYRLHQFPALFAHPFVIAGNPNFTHPDEVFPDAIIQPLFAFIFFASLDGGGSSAFGFLRRHVRIEVGAAEGGGFVDGALTFVEPVA